MTAERKPENNESFPVCALFCASIDFLILSAYNKIIQTEKEGSAMKYAYQHPADEIVATMNRLYYHGMTTTSGGNLSIMDEDNVLWISPTGVDKGNLMREDVMQVLPDGTFVGRNRPSVEYPFHLSVRKVRPDLRAVLHAHPTPLVAFSLMRQIPDVTLLPDTAGLCGKISMATYAIPGSQQLGDYISAEFAKGYNTVMLENHGVVIGAPTMHEAFRMFETLDFTARVQIAAATLGKTPAGLTSAELARYTAYRAPVYGTLPEYRPSHEEIDARNAVCRMNSRAYGLQLYSAVDGVTSVRLADGSQLITPEGNDALTNTADDLVRVAGSAAEGGKTPSKYAEVCRKIYEKYPEFKAVMIARCPNIMAFAHTDAAFDARLIPESYIQLKNVPVLPFMALLDDTDAALSALSPKNPVAIVKGDCVISCGTSLLAAYDHLEVLEYSARSLVACAAVGTPVVKLSDKEVRDIEVAFGL